MQQIKSAFLSLTKNDLVKAGIVAVLTPVAGYLGQLLTAFAAGGSFAFDWTTAWHLALSGATAYLVKQFLTNSQGSFLSAEPASASVASQ